MEPDQQTSQPADDLHQASSSLSPAVFLTDPEMKAAGHSREEKIIAIREQDKKLIIAAQQDSKAFNQLYTKYWQDVRSYFLRHVGGDKTSADDLAQDTFFRALRYLSAFRAAHASYRTYLLRIAHNLLVNFYREKKTSPLEEANRVSDRQAGKFQDVIARDNLWQQVAGLPESERQVLFMMYQEGMSVREIALLLNKTENAVKLLLSRGRAKLRGQDRLR